MTVSAIIPVYNDEAFIAEAINSCLDIPGLNEIIVINDGSTDNSLKIVKTYSDAIIKILHHPNCKNKGRSSSRNLGIVNATSEWIIFCDADDWICKNRLDFLNQVSTDGINAFYSNVGVHFEEGIDPSNFQFPRLIPPGILPEKVLNYLITHREEAIGLLGLTIKKDALIQVGLFDESLEIGEDTDLIWRLAHHAELHYSGSHQALAIRRVHAKNTYQDVDRLNVGRYQFYKKWKECIEQYNLNDLARKRILKSYRYYRRVKNTSLKAYPKSCI